MHHDVSFTRHSPQGLFGWMLSKTPGRTTRLVQQRQLQQSHTQKKHSSLSFCRAIKNTASTRQEDWGARKCWGKMCFWGGKQYHNAISLCFLYPNIFPPLIWSRNVSFMRGFIHFLWTLCKYRIMTDEMHGYSSKDHMCECNGCMPVRTVCKPHSPDLKRGALATDARGCSLWRSLLECPPPAWESRVRDPLGTKYELGRCGPGRGCYMCFMSHPFKQCDVHKCILPRCWSLVERELPVKWGISDWFSLACEQPQCTESPWTRAPGPSPPLSRHTHTHTSGESCSYLH